ncbi:MAG: D-alanyl-D-alanine carboxypeptidase family protein [Pseudomonadota bacterium]
MQRNASRSFLVTSALIMGAVVAGYVGLTQWARSVNPGHLANQFDAALNRGDHQSAVQLGERLLKLLEAPASSPLQKLMPEPAGPMVDPVMVRHQLARAQRRVGDYRRSVTLLENVLSEAPSRNLSPLERLFLESDLAQAHLLAGDISKGVAILSSFLELSGDAAFVPSNNQCPNFFDLLPSGERKPVGAPPKACLRPAYGQALAQAADVFAQTLPLVSAGSRLRGDVAGQLASANQMLALGSFYSVHQEHLYAAAGLLSAAYASQKTLLPENDRALSHAALVLAPLFRRLGRPDEAERLLLRAFNAEESRHGSLLAIAPGEPETDRTIRHLGLYLTQLADLYIDHSRYTEGLGLRNLYQAQLRESRRQPLVRTARYLDEKRRGGFIDRVDITQPAAIRANGDAAFTRPGDLVQASAYAIPVRINRPAASDSSAGLANPQMPPSQPVEVRLAQEGIPGDEYANLPIQLSRMMAFCSDTAPNEAIAVAAGHTSGHGVNAPYDAHVHKALHEHQLGLAIDLEVNGRRMGTADKSWLCLTENAYRFGFIASLVGNQTPPQARTRAPSHPAPWHPAPWHWRFVGRDAAQLFRDLGSPAAPQAFLATLDCFVTRSADPAPIKLAQTCQGVEQAVRPISTVSAEPPATGIASGLRTGDPVTPTLNATDRALAYGPAFTKRGRFLNAHTLYANALRETEAPAQTDATSITPERALIMGLLADNYERRGMISHGIALRAQMARLLRRRIFALDDASSATAPHGQDHTITRPVSKTLPLPATYAPGDLIAAADYGVAVSKDPRLDEMKIRLATDNPEAPSNTTLPARLRELLAVCSAQDNDRALSLRSGYRAYKTQASLFQRLRHRGTVTPPGFSEHQTGLGVDVDINGSFMREKDPAYTCFRENAHHYGFILSYPKGNKYLPGKDTFEPWHWRYVGVDAARLFHRSGPANHPQEFLAALPCYEAQEVARANGLDGDLKDYCLYADPSLEASDEERAAVAVAAFEEQQRRQRALEAQAAAEKEGARAGDQDDPSVLTLTPEDAARILNTPTQSGTNR